MDSLTPKINQAKQALDNHRFRCAACRIRLCWIGRFLHWRWAHFYRMQDERYPGTGT